MIISKKINWKLDRTFEMIKIAKLKKCVRIDKRELSHVKEKKKKKNSKHIVKQINREKQWFMLKYILEQIMNSHMLLILLMEIIIVAVQY